ncbi:MAG: tetratricopeptide repeat protein [Chloroflexi bacterium]|nr:tetratricopeptide repeat protein [Chloroflexota bacterium]
MTVISIREQVEAADGSNAAVSFDREEIRYPASVTNPFSPEEEELVEWYFEEHLHLPFVRQVEAQAAAASIKRYGEALFEQVFADRDAYSRYQQALQAGLDSLHFEIVGSPEFHSYHWEALRDPSLPRPLVLEAPMVRRNVTTQPVRARVRPWPTINLLIVTARPKGRGDVSYRTISRPLVESLSQAKVRVHIEILRPGTYEELVNHLESIRDRHGSGFYHVIHFDVHGGLLTHPQIMKGYETDHYLYQGPHDPGDSGEYEGSKAFLLFEGKKEGQAHPVEASKLADLLISHQVPIVVLNACQSGKQVGVAETSLGSRLMQSGVQVALAMGYSVTVTAAELMMGRLYEQLFSGLDLSTAIRRARLELYNQRGRRAYFDQVIDLEDWLLPVVYQNQEMRLEVRDFTPEEHARYYERRAERYRPTEPAYGFVGRDLDILEIEKRLLSRRNMLLIRGMGGAGKTTLLHHLGFWWQTTHFVDQVFYFGYDERPWSLQQILVTIAQKLLSRVEYAQFQPLSLKAQQEHLSQLLRSQRHLVILDNLESITGTYLAIKNILPPEEREALRRFLAQMVGGKTLVLLGSRGGEDWLAQGTFGDNVYELPGLDPEAASTLADRILDRYGATRYRSDQGFQRLLKLLDGYPLPIEVVLDNLARQRPEEVLAALEAGDVALDKGDTEKKNESILRCIEYSHSNLSPEAQGLLTCLAPFTSVINVRVLEQYTAQLRQQPALAHLPYERWQEVLQAAANWGLLSPHPEVPGFLRLQPTLPYFLRSRLNAPEQAEVRRGVETAFRQHYEELGVAIAVALQSKEPEQRQMGQMLASLEYENMATAMGLALEAQVSISGPYQVLSLYLDAIQDQRRGLELGESVLRRLEGHAAESLVGPLGVEFVAVLINVAKRQLLLKQYPAAEASYQKALSLHMDLNIFEEREKALRSASIYHQLGIVAQEQRRWPQAEGYYQQALAIKIEFQDRYSQAVTYHQLGRVAQGQRRWPQAEGYYQQALAIFIEFQDRYSQASTYHQLGVVAQEQRRWPQAEGYYQQALAIEIEFQDRYEQASTYHQLGMAAQEQRRWPQAEGYYQQALAIKIEFQDRYSQASTYHQLGMVAQEQRRWPQARDYFLTALKTYVDYKDSHDAGIVLSSLARLWMASGDADIPAAVASILGVTADEAENLLRRPAGEG